MDSLSAVYRESVFQMGERCEARRVRSAFINREPG